LSFVGRSVTPPHSQPGVSYLSRRCNCVIGLCRDKHWPNKLNGCLLFQNRLGLPVFVVYWSVRPKHHWFTTVALISTTLIPVLRLNMSMSIRI
jgi:hypothetical protein